MAAAFRTLFATLTCSTTTRQYSCRQRFEPFATRGRNAHDAFAFLMNPLIMKTGWLEKKGGMMMRRLTPGGVSKVAVET